MVERMNQFRTLSMSHQTSVMDGFRFIESEAATALPTGKPYADDTREMVEHFDRLGLIQRKPAAFRTPYGFYIHPTLMREVRQKLSLRIDAMASEVFFSGARI